MKRKESNEDSAADVSTMSSVDDNAKLGCGILAKYPVASVLIFAAAGLGTGYGLSVWEPSNEQTKSDVIRWVGLIGDMFLRALKCIVLPLVFTSVILSTVDMLRMGKARKVVFATLGIYLITTIMAAIIGIVSALIYNSLFIVDPTEADDAASGLVGLACDKAGKYSMTRDETSGIISCQPTDEVNATMQRFWLDDVENSFVHTSGVGVQDGVSLSDTVYEGVFVKLISDNIVSEFVSANFGAVIVFASVFGVALHRATKAMHQASGDGQTGNAVLCFFRELERTFIQMINWVLVLTPFAVWSLIANALGKNEDLKTAFLNVGFLVAAALTAFALQFLITYCGLFMIITKSNPFKYLKHLVPAQVMAFATSSSAATIPVNMQCVISSKQVSPMVAKFVVPLGSTVNMDGTAAYMIVGLTFLAVTSGVGDQLNVATFILMAIIATIGSMGTAPVPSASLVLILTAYNTVFNTDGATPASFSFIFAIDWLLDRFRTVLNVTGDAVVARMVSSIVSDDDFDAEDDSDVSDAAVDSDSENEPQAALAHNSSLTLV